MSGDRCHSKLSGSAQSSCWERSRCFYSLIQNLATLRHKSPLHKRSRMDVASLQRMFSRMDLAALQRMDRIQTGHSKRNPRPCSLSLSKGSLLPYVLGISKRSHLRYAMIATTSANNDNLRILPVVFHSRRHSRASISSSEMHISPKIS
jgi:hypothetical protein